MSTVPGGGAGGAVLDADTQKLWRSFDCTSIAVGVVLLYATVFWFVSDRKWFTGPRAQGSEAELEAIESRLSTAEHLEATF